VVQRALHAARAGNDEIAKGKAEKAMVEADKAAIKARKEESAALQTQKKSSDLVGATLVAVMPLGPVGAATLGFNSMTIYFQWASSIPKWVGDCR
jgi:hypothetical protein